MPAAVKTQENMTKHTTNAQREARIQAEAETLPDRSRVKLKAPAYVKRDRAAAKYWRATLERMEGITLLDDLDTEMLAVYCTMLSRRDSMNELCRQLLAEAEGGDLDAEQRLEAVSKLDALMSKLQGQERTILQYADKLGLTPSGRVRLARKRAEAREVTEDDELFGD